jgi:hypothetical protein
LNNQLIRKWKVFKQVKMESYHTKTYGIKQNQY